MEHHENTNLKRTALYSDCLYVIWVTLSTPSNIFEVLKSYMKILYKPIWAGLVVHHKAVAFEGISLVRLTNDTPVSLALLDFTVRVSQCNPTPFRVASEWYVWLFLMILEDLNWSFEHMLITCRKTASVIAQSVKIVLNSSGGKCYYAGKRS